MSSPTGFFLTLEGIDGAGKSSHLEWIAEVLRGRGRAVRMTREPGGTALAEALRTLVLAQDMDALSETLIVFAARRDHLRRVIEPALARGECVVCDRFTDATFAYQGGGRGVEEGILRALERWVQHERQPDLTLWFDLAPAIAAERRRAVRAADRFESLDDAFFERVRRAYAQRATASPDRFARIDGEAPHDAVRRALAGVFRERGLG